MAGILDSKSRIMDVVITEQGRRQLASGQMKIEYATFTDLGAFYSGDEDGVLEDPSVRIYFEAASDLPSDLVTLETDDSGLLTPYRADNFAVGGNNMVLSGSLRSKTAIAAAADAICRRSRRARAFLRRSLQVRRRRGGRRVRGLGLRQIRLQSILHTLQHKVAFLHTSGHVPATWMQSTTYAAVAARQRGAPTKVQWEYTTTTKTVQQDYTSSANHPPASRPRRQ